MIVKWQNSGLLCPFAQMCCEGAGRPVKGRLKGDSNDQWWFLRGQLLALDNFPFSRQTVLAQRTHKLVRYSTKAPVGPPHCFLFTAVTSAVAQKRGGRVATITMIKPSYQMSLRNAGHKKHTKLKLAAPCLCTNPLQRAHGVQALTIRMA